MREALASSLEKTRTLGRIKAIIHLLDMTYQEYELMVKRFIESRLREQGQEVAVQHQKSFTSTSGNTYNIDLSYETTMAGFRYLTIIECKNWGSHVGREKIGYLKSIVDDLKAQKGIVISSKGFQRGAIEFAKSNNIGLLKITNEQSNKMISYYDGGMKQLELMLESEKEMIDHEPFGLAGLFGTSTSIINFIANSYGKNLGKFLEHEFSPAMLDYQDLGLDLKVKEELIKLPENWTEKYRQYETAGLGYKIANEAELRIISLQLSLLKTRI